MTKSVIAAAALNQTPLAWQNNIKNIISAIKAAKACGVKFLCLPELSLTGCFAGNLFLHPYIQKCALNELINLLPETKDITLNIGLPLFLNNKLYNAACLICDGEIKGFTLKHNLTTNTLWDEKQIFSSSNEASEIKIGDNFYPVNPKSYHCFDKTLALVSGADDLKDFHNSSVDIIFNPSADYFAFEKFKEKKKTLLNFSENFSATLVYANLLGNEGNPVIFDGAILIIQKSEILSEGSRFSYKDYSLIKSDSSPQTKKFENSLYLKEEEFARACALGLFDYLRKSHCKSFLISLSGGADSASCACLVSIMIKLALKELPLNDLSEKLQIPEIKEISSATAVEDLSTKLLTCVYQASANSSATTSTAATKLAQEIAAKFYSINISGIVQQYTDIAEQALGRKLTWQDDDQALQNIQARVRLPSAWFFANLQNALLLATGNRSEALVGYATMDGDTAGALAPLAGIDKAFIREWLKWLESEGLDKEIKFPALSYINAQAPTAELRPAESKQTDEKDLMPYAVLSQIEKLALFEKHTPQEIFDILQKTYPDIKVTEISTWIDKFYQLVSRNQWKKTRYAQGFHVDDGALSQVESKNFPNVSTNFGYDLDFKI